MRPGSFLCVLLCLAGCSSGGIGDRCSDHGDCDSTLQCVQGVCVPRCERAPECGDGYACDPNGICRQATGQVGDSCASQVDCSAGLACELDDAPNGGQLGASCQPEAPGSPAGETCALDTDCRSGTCALGHCVDLCTDTRDCPAGTSCTQMPRIEAQGAMFGGCLQSIGLVQWSIPISRIPQTAYLPIPASASSVAVTFSVDDPNQKVGVIKMTSPTGDVLIEDPTHYFTNAVRHQPELAQSVLAMPSSVSADMPNPPLAPGAYVMDVTSISADGVRPGSATPSVTAVIKVDPSVLLDLHFYFLDIDDHPCAQAFGPTLDAAQAQTASFFQTDFIGQLRSVFEHGGVSLGTLTYEDLRNHPELDGLDVANAAALLALGAHDTGVNVFFVRTLSPVGLQAFGPNPGPAGLASTRQSGIIISLDTLCYRSWATLARLTAHELARYMGLYDNIDLDGNPDPIFDSDTTSTNLMFYSELGGADLSSGQRWILGKSTVLR
jgi:hypothetical protein